MPSKFVCLLLTLSFSTLPLLSASEAGQTTQVYFIGNSLTMSTTLDRVHSKAGEYKVDLQFGSQLSGGKRLIRHLNYENDPGQRWVSWKTNQPHGETFEPDDGFYRTTDHRFGLYPEALTKNH